MTLTKSQQIMVADGCPPALFISQAQRAAAWAAMPPRPMPALASPTAKTLSDEAAAILAEQDERRRLKAKARIGKLLRGKARVDRTGQRWDSRRNKWVSATVPSAGSEGSTLAGGAGAAKPTSPRNTAPRATRQANPPGSGEATARAGQPEGIRAKARAAAKGAKAGSKTEIIAALLRRPEGCTTADILAATGWPSVSVPAQAKAAGLDLVKDKSAGKVTRYRGTPRK